MIKASDAAANTVVKPEFSIDEYMSGRIQAAMDNGYTSTTMWIKNKNYEEATSILKGNGYEFETLKAEINSVQLSVVW